MDLILWTMNKSEPHDCNVWLEPNMIIASGQVSCVVNISYMFAEQVRQRGKHEQMARPPQCGRIHPPQFYS